MEIEFDENRDGVVVAALVGSLNDVDSDELLARVDSAIGGGSTRIVLDCAGLDFVSSYGLGVLVRLRKRLAGAGGEAKLAAVPETVKGVLRLTRLDKVFSLYPDVESAVDAFVDGAAG